MSDLQLYQNPQLGRVRVILKEDAPWFVMSDVCDGLDLTNISTARERLDKDELSSVQLNSGGQRREMLLVSESGLYSLILGSRKPEAKAFKRWITHDVIPAIRRNGVYATPDAVATLSDKELMARAVLAANETIKRIEAEREAERALTEQMKVERDNAIATKSQISSKREATIMGKLGNAGKKITALTKENTELKEENTELKDKLGMSTQFMTVENIPWTLQYMQFTPYRGTLKINVYNRLGTALSRLCSEKGITMDESKKVMNPKGNKVNVYPVSVINVMEQYILSKDASNQYYRFLSDYMRPKYRA